MKIRQLADAAVVAALLLANIPGLNPNLTPADLLQPPAACAQTAPEIPDDPDDGP